MNTSDSRKRSRRATTAVVALVLVAALGLGALSLFAGSDSGSGSRSGNGTGADAGAGSGGRAKPPSAQERALTALQRRAAGDPAALGEKDAPVVLIEYADFQCPFCGKFARNTKPELIEKYVAEGVLRIEWRHFPVFGDESRAAARAGWAAGEQGRFWEFHDVAFGTERRKNSGEFADDRLVAMAEEAGVQDLERFRRDMKSPAAKEAVARDAAEGHHLGVTSTPAFLINSTPVLGAQPAEVFEDAIDRARAAAGDSAGDGAGEKE
ncbi:DsbA family protein [Streptomyces sp. MAR4 CNX-425]|uniref:DsbA family protein n=1 Tax=Streptomyces sp. MAR4 CNX-425 TaxID=3406343 RepID=UPI003B5030ED